MLNGPFTSWPNYDAEEKRAVVEVLDSNRVNYWTGDKGREFERQFAYFCETEFAVAVANGSVALDLAWIALDLPAGAEVIVTSRTFLASVSSIVLAGLTPVFADVDRNTQNVTAETVREKINHSTGAILCVHLAGWPCPMDEITELAKDHDLYVVEDCAQAHGAKLHGKPVGGWGDIAAWSFCQDKIMTTAGEGGMVTTNNHQLWHKVWSYKDHGKSWQAVHGNDHPPGFRWLHESFGTNWRMTEMQAAVGLLQLKKMPDWQAQRQKNASAILDAAHKCHALRVPTLPQEIEHAWYKCYVFVRPELLMQNWSRDKIMNAISAAGVPCFSGSCSEVYNEKAFVNTGFQPTQPLPVAAELGETSLMFLVHPGLTSDEISKTCQVLQKVVQEASKP